MIIALLDKNDDRNALLTEPILLCTSAHILWYKHKTKIVLNIHMDKIDFVLNIQMALAQAEIVKKRKQILNDLSLECLLSLFDQPIIFLESIFL